MPSMGLILLFGGAVGAMLLLYAALSGPATSKATTRRLESLRERHSRSTDAVAEEIPDPVGIEFRMVSDKMKIGRTMDSALNDTAERLGTPEFQFFVISLAIQRETGGNLAETLSNLADVLRKRAAMKLKIRAMSSESKASAYIIGALPFIVFTLVWMINPHYMAGFFSDQRLEVAGIGGMIWMVIGAFIMAKMVNFEI